MYDSAKILSMSNEELDLVIAEYLLEDELCMKPVSDNEKRFIAQKWFENNLDRFRSAICSNSIVRKYLLGKDTKTQIELFAAVMDALSISSGCGKVPVAVLSARLINYGLEKLCPPFD
jgi:hypothetical protein